MLKLSSQQKQAFAQAVESARQSSLVTDIEPIYARFEVARAARNPICRQSGACCHFEKHGHRLFVTVMEVAHFARLLERAGKAQEPAWDGTGCPYQQQGLCSVHAVRPFGCRVYFCDSSSTEWQNSLYEQLHREIRELHDRAGVPYLYVEWREALDSVGLLPQARKTGGLPIIA